MVLAKFQYFLENLRLDVGQRKFNIALFVFVVCKKLINLNIPSLKECE